MPPPLSADEPVLRTLAPALAELHHNLAAWLQARHPDPPSVIQKAALTGLCDDLARQSDALKLEQPLLVIALMGGTGVGKSSLLNALAGSAIASSSFVRPTTRDPVVYLHESVDAKRLDPALQMCRMASHNRDALRTKVLVDTPDMDSTDHANRDKLLRMLPVADIVLYVGSQEKYHDQMGWDLFLEQKKRRAFAFILNKWDRCQNAGVGARPDEDWIRDLQANGFHDPVLFRTCAQHWIDHPWQGKPGPFEPAVPGEQFHDLVQWLESGVNRLEIESIKARGVGQLLDQLTSAMNEVCPPDLSPRVKLVAPSWDRLMHEEADEAASLLLTSLDPHHADIETHFADRRRQLFTGPMSGYLSVVQKVRAFAISGSWRSKLTWIPALPTANAGGAKAVDFNLVAFLGQCSQEASERHLHSRHKAFANRLLLDAETHGIPARLLESRVESTSKLDWNTRHAQAMLEVLGDVERTWAEPTGPRLWIQRTLVVAGNTLPSLSLLAMTVVLLWQYFYDHRVFNFTDLILPVAVVVFTMIVLHVLIALLIPMRWPALRSQFHGNLRDRMDTELTAAYAPLPSQLADDLNADRQRVQNYLKEVEAVADWLQTREQAARVDHLFEK